MVTKWKSHTTLTDQSGKPSGSARVEFTRAATLGTGEVRMADEKTDIETALETFGISSHSEGDKQQTFRSADELIRLADRLKAEKAAAQPHRGLRFTKLIPPGTG